MTNVLTPEQYKAVVDAGRDYCDCCGGLYEIAGLSDTPAMMPDPEDPTALLSGFTVCRLCASHCEDGPCQPDNLTVVRDPGATWAHREAGLAIQFQWQESTFPAQLDHTTVLGKLPGTETYVVLCEGTAYDHSTPFPVKGYLTVTKGKDDKAIIDDATDEQVALVTQEQEEPPPGDDHESIETHLQELSEQERRQAEGEY